MNRHDVHRLSREAEACYGRLFWGSNLMSMTLPGEQFEPVWGAVELVEIRQVMAAGLALLAAELHSADGPAET